VYPFEIDAEFSGAVGEQCLVGEPASVFLSALREQVQRALTLYSRIPGPAGVSVGLQLGPDGGVEAFLVPTGTPHPDLELAIERAIIRASPFGPLPGGHPRCGVDLRFRSTGDQGGREKPQNKESSGRAVVGACPLAADLSVMQARCPRSGNLDSGSERWGW
jgi:hypothetical protein